MAASPAPSELADGVAAVPPNAKCPVFGRARCHPRRINLKRAVQSRGSATELFIPMPDKPSRELEKDLIAMHDRLKHLSP